MGVVTTDDTAGLAFWHRGLGRVAALTAEVDGQYSRRLNGWRDFPQLAVGLGRCLLGGEPPTGVQASIDREGGQGLVRVDLDPSRERSGSGNIRGATATIVPPDTRTGARPERLTLSWVSDDTLEARFPLQKPGLYLGAVQLGSGAVLPLAPLSLPYSPEFEPRIDPLEGRRTLAEIARLTGGAERTTWDDVFSASRLRNRQVSDLVWPLTLALLLLHVLEIGGAPVAALCRRPAMVSDHPSSPGALASIRGRRHRRLPGAGPAPQSPASGEMPPSRRQSPRRPRSRARPSARPDEG